MQGARHYVGYVKLVAVVSNADAWNCGMVAGLIHDVPTCQAPLDRIMLQAKQLIRQRLVLSLN
jgi:hypothetical protein